MQKIMTITEDGTSVEKADLYLVPSLPDTLTSNIVYQVTDDPSKEPTVYYTDSDGKLFKPVLLECTEPPIKAHWHHGNGILVCGGVRIAREDFDTDPRSEYKKQIFDWMCDVLNKASGC